MSSHVQALRAARPADTARFAALRTSVVTVGAVDGTALMQLKNELARQYAVRRVPAPADFGHEGVEL